MSIAQLSVAGEGKACPKVSVTKNQTDDSVALAAFQSDSVNLPWIIFRAAFRANHIQNIPQRARAVLSALARTVDAGRPFGTIFARRELLTSRAMQSVRTFYRSLSDLEAAGLIERRPQGRYVEAGRFARAYLHLTDEAAILLGLVEPPTRQVHKAVPPAAQLEHAGAATQRADSFDSPNANLAHGAIYKDLSPDSFQKRQPGQVPADLERLRSLGFVDFLIFKLMRQARESGKRLSHVVEVSWDHLKAADRPINYLKALLNRPIDFTHLLARRTTEHTESLNRQRQLSHADRVARESAGKTFIDAKAELKYVVDTDGESIIVYSVNEAAGRQAAAWKEKFAKAYATGYIRLASAQDIEAFEQARQTTIDTKVVPQISQRGNATHVAATTREHVSAMHKMLRGHSFALRTLG